ncbi:MAG: DUF4038 domain-containing protein [Candidatus Brocadiia bacterium]
MRRRLVLLGALALLAMKGCTPMPAPPAAVPSAEANRMIELAFSSAKARDRAPHEIELDVVFTTPDGAELRVPAFWAGGETWKVRYASPTVGVHAYRTECSDPGDAGLHGVAGKVEVVPYEGDNPLYRHGPVRVAEDRGHFAHADGTPFFWLGDTWWMGLCRRLHWPDEFQALAADRKAKGFTVVQLVAGLYPDTVPFDERCANEAGQAWTAGYGRVRPEYFDLADRRILHLVEQGLVPCIVGAWHQHMPLMGAGKMKRHWRTLVARYGALPVLWCLGGEINARSRPKKHAGGLEPVMDPAPDSLRAAWTDVARYVQATDPFDRVLGTHNVGDLHVLDDDALLDMYFMQTGHSALSTLQCALEWLEEKSQAGHRAPMVHAEANYQWLFAEGSYDDPLQRHQFWAVLLAGAAGHTYGANGIWQVNRAEEPFGPSPHGFDWGTTSWDVAMAHAASAQLGASKRFLQSLPWTELAPARDAARFVLPPLEPTEETAARWVRPPDPEPRMTLLGTTFDLPPDRPVRRAVLRLACRAPHSLMLSGQMVYRASKLAYREKHHDAVLFPLAGEYLRPGRNRIVVRIDREGLDARRGLLAHLRVELGDGSVREVVSDASWRWAQPDRGWPGDVLRMGPSGWPAVEEVEAPGGAAQFAVPAAFGPHGARVGERLWLVYVPAALPVELSGLPAEAPLELVRFDPRRGEAQEPEPIAADEDGRWRWEPPQTRGDWVLLVRRPQPPAATNREP